MTSGPVAYDGSPLHMWSLAVEEQFYLAFPLIVVAVLWWLRRRGGTNRVRTFTIVISAVTALSFVASVVLTYANFPFGIGAPTRRSRLKVTQLPR